MIDLRFEGVTFAYPGGPNVLQGIDLLIPAGQRMALMGANGSGKTTLVRHLDGLLRPSAGRVLVGGDDAAALRVAQLAARVGLCFQHPDRQIFARDLRSEVAFGPRHLGAGHEEVLRRATAALGTVGLGEDLGRHPDDLGEAQRKLLTIAAVLAMETPVVVLDEPTTGLDANGVTLVQRIVGRLGEEGRTVIAISHDLRFVAETFERVVVLEVGRVALDGTPAEVFAEASWPSLRRAGLEPPQAAVAGARLGLGSTPTDAAVVEALRERSGRRR